MIEYTLYDNWLSDDARETIETTSLEKLMLAIAEIPEDDIWQHGISEYDITEIDAYGCGERVLFESLDEWLFDFIGRSF